MTVTVDQPGSLELTVLMPCLNEAETVATCIRSARGFLQTCEVEGEVLVADNGSTDGSGEIAEREGARVTRVAAKGYGSALYRGAVEAKGRYVIMGDADGSYDFRDLMPFLERLRAGADLVMGNRFAGGIKPGAMPRLNRYLGNPILSWLGRLLFDCPIHDFHSGLRGFSRVAFDRMNLQTTGMEYASEMVIKATLLGMRLEEVPIVLSPDGRSRGPHLQRWRDGWRHLRFMLIYSPRWLFLYPGMVLMAVGLAALMWLLPGPRQVGGVIFDVHTLLFSSAAVLVGCQAVSFAIFTTVYAAGEDLLPANSFVQALKRRLPPEFGVPLGLGLVVFGLLMSLESVGYWRDQAFGPLDPSRVLRLVIPAVLSVALGVQVTLSSFFLSVLLLRTRTRRS